MKIERRWLKSALEEAAKEQPAMPWQRGLRCKPEAMQTAAASDQDRFFAAE